MITIISTGYTKRLTFQIQTNVLIYKQPIANILLNKYQRFPNTDVLKTEVLTDKKTSEIRYNNTLYATILYIKPCYNTRTGNNKKNQYTLINSVDLRSCRKFLPCMHAIEDCVPTCINSTFNKDCRFLYL